LEEWIANSYPMREKKCSSQSRLAMCAGEENGGGVVDQMNAGGCMSALTIAHGRRQLGTVLLRREAAVQMPMGSGIEMEEIGTARGHKDGAKGHVHKRHDKGLLAIGLFKLVEAVFFFLVGVGAIHFLHRDLGDAAQNLATKLRINQDGRVWGWVFDHLDSVTSHRLKQIGAWTFFFAGVRVAEGVGLVLEKTWAEYMTVGVTVSFLPWEMYEIVTRLNWFRVGLFVMNLLVLAYLVWWLRRKRDRTDAL
jgi:uncharacterized membrane protein (DUF2068 family)